MSEESEAYAQAISSYGSRPSQRLMDKINQDNLSLVAAAKQQVKLRNITHTHTHTHTHRRNSGLACLCVNRNLYIQNCVMLQNSLSLLERCKSRTQLSRHEFLIIHNPANMRADCMYACNGWIHKTGTHGERVHNIKHLLEMGSIKSSHRLLPGHHSLYL